MASLEEVLGQIFDLYDSDKSGFIEQKEGMSIAHFMGKKGRNDYWNEMLKAMDTDGDGKISKDEYITYSSKSVPLDDAIQLKNQLLEKGFPLPATAVEAAATMPTAIAMFFDGEPMATKAEKWMGEMVADSYTGAFVGPHAMPLPPMDKEKFGAAAGNLMASFPDLTFNASKVVPTKNADGSWGADIIVTGTHTGPAYSPMADKLPPIDKADPPKKVTIGPETFTLWVDDANKVCKLEITPLGAGHPHGPPGFYKEIGGDLSPLAPPAE